MIKHDKQSIVIIGLGLLGSSLAASLKNNAPLEYYIIGVSSPASVTAALQAGMIDCGFGYEESHLWIAQADMVFICTPIEHIMQYLKTLHQHKDLFQNHCIISDIGSTKQEICKLGWELFPGEPSCIFVGGHPMAGSHKKGIAACDPHLYESAYWIFCPPLGIDATRMAPLFKLAQCSGSRLCTLDPMLHDRITARISHAPQLISSVLAAAVSKSPVPGYDAVTLSGGGFRDMTRIAASSFSIWKDIFHTNRQEICDFLDYFVDLLQNTRQSLANGNDAALEQLFSEASGLRAKVPVPGKGFKDPLVEMIVEIQDVPGMFARIIEPLTNAGLDIRDIELLKVREGLQGGGTLLLAFNGIDEAQSAAAILNNSGLRSTIR
jgi:prephenate dehydrogenase